MLPAPKCEQNIYFLQFHDLFCPLIGTDIFEKLFEENYKNVNNLEEKFEGVKQMMIK